MRAKRTVWRRSLIAQLFSAPNNQTTVLRSKNSQLAKLARAALVVFILAFDLGLPAELFNVQTVNLGPLHFKLDGEARATAGINQQVNFQARLLNSAGAVVPDGNYNMQFKIYQDGDGVLGGGDETLKWTESRLNNNSQGVVVKNGYFSVNLGSVTAFGSNVDWNQDTLWLSLNIGNTNTTCTPFSSCAGDGEMSPFKRLAANPYALNSNQLGGLTSGQYVQLAQGLQADASTANASIGINKTGGTANILDLQRSGSSVLLIDNNGTATHQATGDNVSLKVKQTSTASPTADIFDVLGTNGTSKFIAVTSTAANQGSVTVQSLGSNDLTLDSGSGNLVLGSNTTAIKKSGTALTIDTNSASNSTLTVTNTGAGVGSLSVEGTVTAGTGVIATTGGVTATAGDVTATAGNVNATAGTIQTAGTTRISNTGAFTGTTATFASANALTLGTASTNIGAIILDGSGNGNQLTLQGPTSPAAGNFTLTIPAITANANVCTDNSLCTGYAASATNGYVQLAPSSAQGDGTTNSSIFINKTGASGNILELQKGGADKLVLDNSGNLGIGTSNKLSRLTVKQAADTTNVGGTTTANAATAIVGSSTTFLTSIGIGDRISLSSAAATYATVTAITDDTHLTVDIALGNGTSQTINVKHSALRVDDASNNVKLVVNDLGNVGIGTTNPSYQLDLRGNTSSQLHLNTSSTDSGGYLLGLANNSLFLMGGVSWNGGAWVARDTTASIFDTTGGVFDFFSNSGLTTSNTYTPTERLQISATGDIITGWAGVSNTIQTQARSGASQNTGALTIQSGNATGTTSNSGNVIIDAGTATTTAGSISVGTANASGATLGRVGASTTINGNTSSSISLGNFTVSSAGAIVGVGVNSGSGLLQGTGGLTLTGTTQINGSGTANTTIGNSAGGTITIGASSGSDLALQDAQWSVTGAGVATFGGANALTLGTASTNTGAIILKGSGNGNQLTLQGPASPNAGNYTLTIPAINNNANVCTDNTICSGYQSALSFNNGLTNTSGTVQLGGSLVQATTIAAGNANGITLTSDLSGGIRSSYAQVISQANDASNNNTAGLLQLINSDTASTANVLNIAQNASGGVAIGFGGSGNVTDVNASNVDTGTGLATSGITTGQAVRLSSNNLTTGAGLLFDSTTLNGITSGSALRVSFASPAATAGFTGKIIDVSPTRTLTGSSINDSGNFLNLNRSNTANSAGNTFTVSGALANLTSNCTQTAGTCTDTANLLSLTQSYGSASGAVIAIANSGTGNDIQGSSSNWTVSKTGNITTSGTYNTNTFNSNTLTFGAAGTATISSAASRALNVTGNAASTFSTTSGDLTVQGGSGTVSLGTSTNLTAAGALTVAAGGSNQGLTLNSSGSGAVTVDSGASGTIAIGGTNATTTIGRSGAALTLQGNGSTVIKATASGNLATVGFIAPTTTRNINFPDEGGTLCIQASTNCSFAPAATNGYVQLAPSSAQGDGTTNSSIFINKTGSSGNILELQKSGTDNFVVGNTGNITATGTYNTNTFTSSTLTFGSSAGTVSTPSGDLTLQAGSGNLVVGSSTTLFKSGTSFTVDINSASASTLTVTNSASGAGNLSVKTSVLSPLFDTPSGTTTLNVGTNNATTGINLNQATTIAASKAFTVTSGLTSLTGNTSGDALNVSNSTSTGNIAVFKDNSTAVVTIGDNGAASFTGIQPASGNGVDVLTVTGGKGANTATGGTGGNLSLTAGAGGNGATANGNGGNTSISGGVAGTGAGTSGTVGYVLLQPTSGGRVGIATATPGNYALDINGDTNVGGNFYTGGTQRLSSGGVLANITGYTQTSGNFAQTGGTHTITSTTTSGSIFSATDNALTANNSNLANLSVTNNNTAAAGTTVNGLTLNLANTTPTSSTNVVDGINFAGVSTGSNQAFYGLNFGTNYTDLLRYNSTQLISGAGKIQNAAFDNTLTYSNIANLSNITTGTINSQTISSTANFTGTLAIQGANSLALGTTGTSTGSIAFKGSTAASGTITLSLVTNNPGTRAINLPDEAGTLCIQASTNCGFVAASTALARNAHDTSTIASTGTLYDFSNTNTGAAGVLSLTNSGTNSALSIVQSGTSEPSSGQALIVANNNTTTPTGNLLDLQNKGTSNFSVDVAGNEIAAGNLTVTGTYNSNTFNSSTLTFGAAGTATISSAASRALNITGNAGSTVSTTAGDLTLQAGSGTLNVGTSTTLFKSGTALTIDLNNASSSKLTVTNSGAGNGILSIKTAYQINGSTPTAGHYLRGDGSTGFVDGTIQGSDLPSLSGTYLRNVPAATSDNTIAPTVASVVALTVKGTTGTAANVLEVFDSTGSPARQAFFDNTGSLNVSKVIQPTSSNASDIGLSGTTFRSGYFGTSVVSPVFTGAGTVTVSSGGASDLTLDSASNILVLADGTLRRAAAGTTTFELNDASADTTLSVTNTDATKKANLTVEGLVTANSGVTIPTGFTFTNASSTLNTAVSISNLPTGGNIGTAAATVDVATAFNINQTTSGQTITIPSPTVTTAGRVIIISNVGSASFTLLGTSILTGTSATLIWNGTAWTFSGAGDSSILNQNSSNQTANFRISGSGQANTSLLTPLVDVASAGTLSLGTSTATAISIGKAGVTETNAGNLTINGTTLLKTTTDSASAFQIQNNAGTSSYLFDVDTTNGNITSNQGVLTVNGVADPANAVLNASPSGGSLLANTTYAYRVAAVDLSGTITTAVPTTPASVLTANGPNNNLNTITWNAVTGAQSYRVYRAVNGGSWFVNTIAAGTTTLADNGTTFTWATAGTPPTTNTRLSLPGGAGLSLGSPNGGAIVFQAPAAAVTSYSVTFPTTQGGLNSFLLNDGSGNLTWGTTTCGSCVVLVPTTSAQNTIAPTAASVVSLTVKGTTNATTAHVLDIYNAASTPTLQAFFDAAGALTASQLGTFSAGLTLATGSTFTNASSSLLTAVAIADKPTGGNIGTAAATVDVATSFNVTQTTSGQTLTLPSPTVTTAGRVVYVSNTSSNSTSFIMSGVTIAPNNTAIYQWNGTQWTSAGIDGSGTNYIQNQNSANQTGNFRISGSGQANTSLLTPTVDVASAGTLSLGTSTATAISIGKAGVTETNAGALTVTQGLTALGSFTLGTASTTTGAIAFKGSGGTGTLTVSGPTTPNTGNFTLSIPAITANANICTDNSICTGYQAAPASGSYLQQIPTTTAINTVTPTTNSIVALTVNGTSGTAATTAIFGQSQAADDVQINNTNTTGTITNGALINRNGSGGTTTNGIQVESTAGTLTNGIQVNNNGGTLTNGLVFSGTITTDIAGAAGRGLTITGNAASTWSTSSGLLTVQGSTSGLTLNTATTGVVTLDSGTTGAVNIGGGANAKTITIGNVTGATAITLQAGTGAIQIGNDGVAKTITVGNTTGATAVTIQSGTGAINVGNDGIAKTLNVGNSTGATAVNIDTGTGGINFGDNANTKSIDIGGVTNSGTDTVNIATNSTAADTVTIGNTNASTVVNIAGGTSGTSSGASGVVIGNATTDATQTNLQLDSANGSSDVGTCSATVNQGSMYYSTATNTIRACSNSAWSDVVTSADMGLQAFGVVPTSGSNSGDLVPVTGFNNGPCKVAITGTTQVTVSACTAYSGGRKVVVTSTNLAITTVASTTEYQWVCLTGTNGAPDISADNTSRTANQPTFSATAPVVCLARVESNGGLLNLTPSINGVVDVRPFSTATFQAVNIVTTAPASGMLVKLTATAGQYTPTSTSAGDVIAGVVVATAANTTANTINAIIATAGPVNIWASAGSINQFITSGGTNAGQAVTNATASATAYGNAGVSQSAFSTTCATNADNCRGHLFTVMSLR